MNAGRNAPFAGWTPELIEQASASYAAEQEAMDRIRHEAYAEGRKDEAKEWKSRILPLLRELHEIEYLSEQQCAAMLGVDLLTWRFAEVE